MFRFVACLFLIVSVVSCSSRNEKFITVASSHSGIHFNNTITETDSVNVLDLENVYNGGGIGVGDFNQDGTQDIVYGPYWWAGPDFKHRHEYAPATQTFKLKS